MHAPFPRSSQWRYSAATTAIDMSDCFVAIALKYYDCSVIEIRQLSLSEQRSQDTSVPELSERKNAEETLELHAHTCTISCLRIFKKDCSHYWIASASSDCIALWKVTFNPFQYTQYMLTKPIPPDKPSSVCFDHSGSLTAVAASRLINIYMIKTRDIYVTLEGHSSDVSACEFHPIYSNQIVTASEDRTFKIWDLEACAVVYQSAVLSAFAILSIALNPLNGDASVGFADGSVRIFTYDGRYAKERMTKDIARIIRKQDESNRENQEEEQDTKVKVISSLPSWAQRDKRYRSEGDVHATENNGTVEPSTDANYDIAKLHREEPLIPILRMSYVVLQADSTYQKSEHKLMFNSHEEKQLVPEKHLLLIATSQYLISMNVLSSKVAILMNFQNQYLSFGAISRIKDICWHTFDHPLDVACGTMSAFEPKVTIFSVKPWNQLGTEESENQHDQNLVYSKPHRKSGKTPMSPLDWSSMIPQAQPSVISILNLPPLPAISPDKASTGSVGNKLTTRSLRIRSSGYGAEMPFQLALAKKKRAQVRKKSVSTSKLELMSKEYPVDCEAIQYFQQKHILRDRMLHNGPIHTMDFSSDAKYLATGGGDYIGQICKLPMNKYQGEGNVFLGHNDAVRLVRWSHSNKTLLTISNDKRACLWVISSDLPSLTWNGAFTSMESSARSTVDGLNRPQAVPRPQRDRTAYRQDVVDAQFFYMDKFVLNATGNSIRLYQYTLDTRFADSKRQKSGRKKNASLSEMKNQSRKSKVGHWEFSDFQQVKAVTCINGSLLSHSIVLSGSDRSIRVFDVATEQTARVIMNAHERSIHTLALPRASCYTSHPSNYYDLLLSSSFTSVIHLWDLRTDYCAMQFNQHKNRIHSIGMAFSPCMRYMTTGSEDRKAVTYDLRTGRALHYLSRHTDVVTSVAYNPLHPQLATASYDGTVQFYSDQQGD